MISKEIKMSVKHMKKCLVSLAIREIKIKTTMRSCLPPVRMDIIKICWWCCGGERNLLHTVVNVRWGSPYRKHKCPQITKTYLSPSYLIPVYIIYLKKVRMDAQEKFAQLGLLWHYSQELRHESSLVLTNKNEIRKYGSQACGTAAISATRR